MGDDYFSPRLNRDPFRMPSMPGTGYSPHANFGNLDTGGFLDSIGSFLGGPLGLPAAGIGLGFLGGLFSGTPDFSVKANNEILDQARAFTDPNSQYYRKAGGLINRTLTSAVGTARDYQEVSSAYGLQSPGAGYHKQRQNLISALEQGGDALTGFFLRNAQTGAGLYDTYSQNERFRLQNEAEYHPSHFFNDLANTGFGAGLFSYGRNFG